MQKKGIFKATLLLSLIIFLSRILGLLRNVFIASYFGRTATASAVTLALTIPYLLRRVLGESALDAFFVPVYTEYKTKNRNPNYFISNVMTVMGVVSLFIIAVGILFMPYIIYVMSAGLKTSSPVDFNYAISLSRITFPFLFFISMLAIFMGIFNANKNFYIPATNSLLLNIFFLSVFFIFGSEVSTYKLGYYIAYVYLIGAFFIFIYQFFLIKKLYGFRFKFKFDLKDEGIRRIFKMMLPALLSMAVFHINFIVDKLFASFIDKGGIATLQFAETIVQFPIGVLAVAIFNTSLPTLSFFVKNDEMEKAEELFVKLLRFIIYIGVPVFFGLWAVKVPLVKLVYEYKKFGANDVLVVATVLKYYLFGIIGYIGVRIVSAFFYAKERVDIPFKTGVLAVFLNVFFDWLLMKPLGLGGLALAGAIAAVTNITVLTFIVYKRYFKFNIFPLVKLFIKSTFASVVMYFSVIFTASFFNDTTVLERVVALFLPVFVGIFVYTLASWILGIKELRLVSKSFLNKIGRR